MNRIPSLRRTAVALAALALLGFASITQAAPFYAEGTYTFTDSRGNKTSGVLDGRSAPGGQFSGEFEQTAKHGVLSGSVDLDYAGGSLTLEYVMAFDDSVGLYVGVYTITGGTGNMAGATGGGDLYVEPDGGDGSGGFVMEGTIDR